VAYDPGVTRTRLTVLLTLALFGAGSGPAAGAENSLTSALKRSASQPRVQVLAKGKCDDDDGKPSRCSVRAESDRPAGYHYYRAFISGWSIRGLRVGGVDHMDSGFINIVAETLAEKGERVKKLPLCWISEDRAKGAASEGFEIVQLSAGDVLRDIAGDLRSGTVTRSGRTLSWVRGAARATLTLSADGLVRGGIVDDPKDGRYRLEVSYPDAPLTQVTPTPPCTDEQLAGSPYAGLVGDKPSGR
jgi:hypothetical protein